MGADRRVHGKRRYLTERNLTQLRLEGAIPYETLMELDEEELLGIWEDFASYTEERNEAMRRQMPKPPR